MRVYLFFTFSLPKFCLPAVKVALAAKKLTIEGGRTWAKWVEGTTFVSVEFTAAQLESGVWWRWALQDDAERTGKEYDYDYDYDYEGGGMRLLYPFGVKHPCQRDIIDIHWGFGKNKCEHKCEQTRDGSTQRMKDEA